MGGHTLKGLVFVLPTAIGSAVYGDIFQYTDEGVWQGVITSREQVSFDDFAGPLSNQYPGLGFSSFNGGNPRLESQSWAHSSPNIMLPNISLTGGGGGWALDFDTPVDGIGFWTNDTQLAGTTITFRDASGQELGVTDLLWPHPLEWVFQGFVSTDERIARIEISIHSSDFIAHDDLQYGFVPAPSTAASLVIAAGVFSRRRRG